jgi:tripartite-type tricarboxylate transporter receptor subunit TctC
MRTVMRCLLACLALVAGAMAQAQHYPSKPLRLIIPFPPGGSNDVVGRAIGAQLAERLGQGVVVDNRGGAGGILGMDAAAKAAPDGYTLLLISVSYPMNIALGRMTPDSMRSYVPVSMLGSGPSVLAVPAASPASSLQDLISLAKSKPGVLNAASAGPGSFQHLATELFKLQSGVDVVIVQYKGGGPALTDLLAGHVQMNLGSLIQILPHIKSGKLKALGLGGARRNAALPEVPTIAEAGVPGFEASNWWGMLAPAGTPAPIVERLRQEIEAVLDSAEIRKRFDVEGAEVIKMSPAAFAAFMTSETEKWSRVVKQGGIKAQ